MIEITTLLLGLVVGVQSIEVSVVPGVATVEVRLDSKPIGTLTGEPWRLPCDFGSRLEPHLLEAIARDAEGRQIGTSHQWINLPRRRAEARLVLESDDSGRPTRARLIWQALDYEEPTQVQFVFDGKTITSETLREVELPPYNPSELHILSAEVEFSDFVKARADAVFGGSFGDRISSELTGVVLEAERRRIPDRAELEERLRVPGRAIEIVAVERPPAELLVIREQSAQTFNGLERLVTLGGAQRLPVRNLLPRILTLGDRVRFVFTTADERLGSAQSFELMPVSEIVAGPRTDSLFRILTGISFPGRDRALTEQRVADAVAVAGLLGSGSNRRRAVLLIRSGDSDDSSRLSPSVARTYLDSLMVPLVVWQFPAFRELGSRDVWGDSVDISTWRGFSRAYAELQRALESQFMVWIEGRHLPQEISLSEGADELRLAGRLHLEAPLGVDQLPRTTAASSAPTRATSPVPRRSGPREEAPGPGAGRKFAPRDIGRIELARRHLGQSQFQARLADLFLLTDVSSPRLLKGLDRLASQVPALYAEHTGQDPSSDDGGLVALFSREEDYRAFESDLGMDPLELAGHATPGLVALFVGDRDRRLIETTFIHELVHLLNFRIFGGRLPPWLEEGLAEEMTLARVGASGKLTLPPLELPDPRRANRVVLHGPLATLSDLVDAWDRERLPSLRNSLEVDRPGFQRSPERRRLYALFAFWVHYLATQREPGSVLLPDFLAAVREGGPTDPASVAASFGTSWDQLESGFRIWLGRLAESLEHRGG
jgi:hypothetical protein